MSETMKALALTSFDEPAAVIDVPVPVPGENEVLVRVGGASLNPYDMFVAMGAMKDYLPYEFPAVLGMDVAGTIEAVGDGAEGFAVGDRVFGKMGSKPNVHDGGFGELATPNVNEIAHTPDEVDDAQAGSLGVAGTTAINAVDAIDPHDGSTVVIVGATGGVGSLAIQLAAARGAHVDRVDPTRRREVRDRPRRRRDRGLHRRPRRDGARSGIPTASTASSTW